MDISLEDVLSVAVINGHKIEYSEADTWHCGKRKEVVDAMLELYGDSWWNTTFYNSEEERVYHEKLRAIILEMANA